MDWLIFFYLYYKVTPLPRQVSYNFREEACRIFSLDLQYKIINRIFELILKMRKEMNLSEKKVELIQWLSLLKDVMEQLIKNKEESAKDW